MHIRERGERAASPPVGSVSFFACFQRFRFLFSLFLSALLSPPQRRLLSRFAGRCLFARRLRPAVFRADRRAASLDSSRSLAAARPVRREFAARAPRSPLVHRSAHSEPWFDSSNRSNRSNRFNHSKQNRQTDRSSLGPRRFRRSPFSFSLFSDLRPSLLPSLRPTRIEFCANGSSISRRAPRSGFCS